MKYVLGDRKESRSLKFREILGKGRGRISAYCRSVNTMERLEEKGVSRRIAVIRRTHFYRH